MSHRTLNLLAWTGSSRLGLFSVRLGPMPSDRAIRVSRPLCSCSARSTCSGAPLQGISSGVTPCRFPSGLPRTFCASSYISRRPYSSVLSLLRLRAARDLRETLAPGTGRPGLQRKHGGCRDDSVRRGFGRSRGVHSPSSRCSKMSGNW